MRDCDDCAYAEWKLTKIGRLHPDKTGRCKKVIKVPALPGAYYWISSEPPEPLGGFIERGKELKDHCPYWERSA